jgi:CHAT domain-containing protein
VGIAFAGANQLPAPDEDHGILTAMAIDDLDLHRVQLIMLSVCETGLGQTAGGEGMLGLQRAFQLAGARSAVTTLWKVRDDARNLLIAEFYANLWDKGLPKLEALRQAQLKVLREGANMGLVTENHPPDAKKRMPPYYWAPYLLSGDWR